MIPIDNLITKEQQDHLKTGGEMIYFVIDMDIEQLEIECDSCGGMNESTQSYCEHCNSELFIDYIDILSPIQPNSKYCLQENCIGDCNIGLPCQSCGNSQGIGTIEREVEFDVEIKRIQEWDSHNQQEDYRALGYDGIGDLWEKMQWLKDYHNNLHPNQPYESNPYIIIAKVKK